jgi:hypothetical protein
MPIHSSFRKDLSAIRILLIFFLWLAVMGRYFHREILPSLAAPEPHLPFSVDALAATGGEEWLGIFYGGEQVGYAHTSLYPGREAGLPVTNLENTIHLDLSLLDRVTRVRVRTFGRLDASGSLSRLTVSASLTSPPLAFEGELEGDIFRIKVKTGPGEEIFSIHLPSPALPAYLFVSLLPRRELRPGETFAVPSFDPLSVFGGENPEMTALSFRVLEKNRDGFLLRTDYRGITAELTLDREGKVRKITTPLGWSLEKQSLKEVTSFLEDAGQPGK